MTKHFNKSILPFMLVFVIGPVAFCETTITGNSMEFVNKGEAVLFKGQVRLERGSDILKADWMRTTKHKDKIDARGKVELNRSMPAGDKLKAFGDEAFYNAKIGDGTIVGKSKPSHVIYHQVVTATSTRIVDMYADKFNFSESASTGTAAGKVYGKSNDLEGGGSYEFWSDQADMDNAQKKIFLSGHAQPKVRQIIPEGDRVIEGDSIVYDFGSKTFEARGRARAVFMDIKKKGPE